MLVTTIVDKFLAPSERNITPALGLNHTFTLLFYQDFVPMELINGSILDSSVNAEDR